jgi:hypothetical protein
VDRHRFNADPNPEPTFDADPDPDFDPSPKSEFSNFNSQQCQSTLFYLSH